MRQSEKRAPTLGGRRGPNSQGGRPHRLAHPHREDNRNHLLDERLLLDEDEVSIVCGVSKNTVRRWMREGLITPVALPFGLRRNLYPVADIEAFLKSLGPSRAPAQ